MNFLRRFFTKEEKPRLEPTWCIADLVNKPEGIGAVVRFLDGRPEGQERFKTAIEITWRFAEKGLPTDEQNAAMNDFERLFDDLTMGNGHSQLVYVRMAFGQKEWLFYTDDRDWFMSEFNRLVGDHPPFPIAISFYDDPEWELWADFIGPLMKRAEWKDTV